MMCLPIILRLNPMSKENRYLISLFNYGASHLPPIFLHYCSINGFEVRLDSSDLLLRYSSALVQGATNVFWIDIQTNTIHFQSLFLYLLEDVALVPKKLKKIPVQARRDLFLLLSRFIFLYNLAEKLESFFQNFPEFPNAFLVGGPADIFVIELTHQLQKLKVEPVLLHYLSHIKVLRASLLLVDPCILRELFVMRPGMLLIFFSRLGDILDILLACFFGCCIPGTGRHLVGTLCGHAYTRYCTRSQGLYFLVANES